MSEVKRITDQLKRAFEGKAWHGPSVQEVLANVTAQQAAARTVQGAHSIWEIALHIATWETIARRRIEGEIIADVAGEVDWPPVVDTGDEAWLATLERLKQNHLALRETVARLDDSRLDEKAAGVPYTIYFLIHGVIQHDLYHAGQIALLRKASA
ncbi:MAG TPA: DinB family protein [Blastocatellia bacterium]|nr:DinB family protein [Blastocatellia bacterium]